MVKSPDTLPCATPPDKVLVRRRIPCSEDAGPGAHVASKNATAALYGFGANEALLGDVLVHHREERIVLTSKCGMHGVNGQRVMLHRGEHIIPIPGTSKPEHLRELIAAPQLELDTPTLKRLDALINRHTVSGARYGAATQAEIDTEEF
ncbi:hypothetical protein ASD35_25535 [Pelomonas sp. Root1444]|nr:hypothetical protein ASD35_25535 [Pelomonas sp. Root1444]